MNLFKIFFSLKITLILFIILSISMGLATFIENDFGTETAISLVYKAKWFEILLFLLILNLSGIILIKKMWKKPSLLMIHISFIIIFVGGFITRYFGYEGTVHIREGEKTSATLSYDPYLRFLIKNGDKYKVIEEKFYVSALGGNSFKKEVHLGNNYLKIELIDFIPVVKREIVSDRKGHPVIKLKIKEKGSDYTDYFLKNGDYIRVGKITVLFNREPKKEGYYFRIFNRGDKFYAESNIPYIELNQNSGTKITKKGLSELKKGYLYGIGGVVLKPEVFISKGTIRFLKVEKPIREEKDLSALVFKIKTGRNEKKMYLLGRGISFKGFDERINIDTFEIIGSWGSKTGFLPFEIYLKDFIIERYPGSDKVSSYKSEVVILDNGNEVPYTIYMNNPLTYKGYKFFQSSYDKDEKGTVLSVNKDLGVIPTYLGYGILFLSLGIYIIKKIRVAF
ncbi:cytochrome c biogenesis protein ResB [Persephonella sp.]